MTPEQTQAEPAEPCGGLIDAAGRSRGETVWQRLNLEQVARRVIQAARVAAAEQVLWRAGEAIRRGRAQAEAVSAPQTDPQDAS